MKKRIQNWLFRKLHGNNLVYNTCWEDPRCDRELLQLDEESEIVMITSAGCNALSYLLDKPNKVYCIDMNSRQNALLELKKAFYKIDSYEHLFACFGKGKLKDVKSFYKQCLRAHLSDSAKTFWDKHIYYFNGKGLRKSFYYHGTSGFLAWSICAYMKMKKQLNATTQQFFQAPTLEMQAQIYPRLDQQLYSKFLVWMMNRHFVMSLAGVPKSQQQLFISKYENGTFDFMKECMHHVFMKLPVHENYFWQLYYQGHYTEECCPDYLKKENYAPIQKDIKKVSTHTSTISDFLKKNPKAYSHYVLLDHQDWLAENDRVALQEEWDLILKNSKKGTKILLRSAAENVDFFPKSVLEKVDFQKEWTDEVHQRDRVGTYASTYLGIVK